MTAPPPAQKILVAGVGNIFLGDDAFGVEVTARLAQHPLPASVGVRDFGVRGYDLSCALLAGYETVILVDAMPRGGQPGTLYVLEPDADDAPPGNLDAHALDPVQVLRFARSLGGPLPRVIVVGCEPTPLDADDMQTGLSDPVRAAVEAALSLIDSLVVRLLAGEPITADA